MRVRWAYGVTTVPQRRHDLLPRTLASLRAAGFDAPRLFVDGERDPLSWEREFGLEVTARCPALRTFGNWTLALWELLIREPVVDRYAIFQDDFVCVRSLRAYLDRCPFPEKGYWNLLTFMSNEGVIAGQPPGWYEAGPVASGRAYHGQMQQTGRGAVALVFSRAAVLALLSHTDIVHKPLAAGRQAYRRVDGCVVEVMNKCGYREWIHNPSLVQHTGDVSSMMNRPHPKSKTFPGEQHDALDFLPRAEPALA